ncbi:hypothetical protein CTAYLR_008513 [Chrysophaeum taylorii]|uniref:Uncharacterized protein n=1 Tax=Chrysophaeum taylorii TaxID=2483200 RepID=A0AAD7XIP4_9STRA|nr:hypothetical protein CTAYLR_008513 [Chrysophaeum taylorii]
MRRGSSRRAPGTSSAAAQVAKEQGLPQGWLAERRSGGHYVVYSPAGERFTSINAARQAARALAEGVPPAPAAPSLAASLAGKTKSCASDYAECVAILPRLGEPVESAAECEQVFAPGGCLRALDAELLKRRSTLLGCWRRGERLEAALECLYASSFDASRAAAAVRSRARERRAAERSWSDGEAVEAARLVDSLSKDLGAVAARLRRPLGEVLAWYYREYKAYWSRRKARWPAKTGYEATKRKRRAALEAPPAEPIEESPKALRIDTSVAAAAESPRMSNGNNRYLLCASPRSMKLQPRGWAPTPRSSAAAHLDLLDDDDDDDDDDDLEEDHEEEVSSSPPPPPCLTTTKKKVAPPVVERVAKTRAFRSEALDAHAALKQRRREEAPLERPPPSDDAALRLSGHTFQGLGGALWYVSKPGDTMQSVAAARSLCPKQLRFVNASLVRGPSIEAALENDLGAGVALLLPTVPKDPAAPVPPTTPKLSGGEVVRRSRSAPLWYVARAGESLAAISLFLAGARVSPGSLEKAPKGKKKLPSPRLGSRFEVDEAGRQHLVDALFREQLKWLAYDEAKTLVGTSLRDKTPVLLPDADPWPRRPEAVESGEEEETTVLGVAPPVLDGEDAEALMRGEIVVERETKRRWAAFAGGEAVVNKEEGIVARPTTDKEEEVPRRGLPRTLRSAAKALGVEEGELRRLNAALGLVSSSPEECCKVSMLLLPEPLRSACAACRASRISAWRCRSELKHAAQPCDKAPQGGWSCGARVRVLAKTKRVRVVLQADGLAETEVEEVGRVWIEARVDRALDDVDGLGLETHGEAPEARKLLVVESQPFDALDGEIQGSHFIGKSRFAVHWPSAHVVACPAGSQPTHQQTRGSASLLEKTRKFLVGRTLDAWGDGPALQAVAAVSLPRWRVVAVYRTVDERLRLSGDDDLVALLEPAARDLETCVPRLYGGGGGGGGGSGGGGGVVVVDQKTKRGYVRYSATRLVASGSGWRACAACVVDGACDVRRCRRALRHDDPDSDAVPALGDAVRLRVPRGPSFFEWLYGSAIAARATRFSKNDDWTPALAPDATVVRDLFPDDDDDDEDDNKRENSRPSSFLEIAVRVSDPDSRDKILAAAGRDSSCGGDVVVALAWPKPRHAVSLPKAASKQAARQPSGGTTAEQRAWVGRFWRQKSDDFTKLRTAISRNDAAKGEARLRLVTDCFESFAEGLDGACVAHVPATKRGASLRVCKAEAAVVRCDAWTDAMVAADALGASLPWHPLTVDDDGDDKQLNDARAATEAKRRDPGEAIELDEAHHYFVCRGGETLSFLAEWTGAEASQLRRANAKIVAAKRKAAKQNLLASRKEETEDEEEEEAAPRRQHSPPSPGPGPVGGKRRRSSSAFHQSGGGGGEGSSRKRQRRAPRRLAPAPATTCVEEDVAFCARDVARIAATPLVHARRVPPVGAVEGETALAAGEAVAERGGAWYACAEDETCEAVARTLGSCEAHEIVAANRHRRPLRALTSRSQLAKWTVLFVPTTTTGGDPKAVRRRKACAACVVAGERGTRACRDVRGHKSPPDFDDLRAAVSPPPSSSDAASFKGARVRVRWVDEDSNSAQWFYATVTGPGTAPRTYAITYDEGDGADEIAWPSPDAVAIPRDAPPRPKVTKQDEALVGKSFEWTDDDDNTNNNEKRRRRRRWIVTDIFDSLDEGVDALVALVRPHSAGRRDEDEEEIYETLEDLRNDATNWEDASSSSSSSSSSSKRRRFDEDVPSSCGGGGGGGRNNNKRAVGTTGVRGLTRLLEEHFGSAFPASRIPPDRKVVVDGNNFAHGIAGACADLGRFEYEDVDALTRQWLASVPNPLTFVFDGRLTADQRRAKGATLASRAVSKGVAAAAFAYEGSATAGPMVVEQVVATLRLAGIRVVLARGEADQEIARMARDGGALALSDDTDLAVCFGVELLRRSTFRPPFGVVWSRPKIAAVLFGDASRERACVELALALGTDVVPPVPEATRADDALAWLVRRLEADPLFEVTSADDDDEAARLALSAERARYEGCADEPPVPAEEEEEVGSFRIFPDEASLGLAALEACTSSAARKAALERVLRGERTTLTTADETTFADRDAAREFELRCRDLLREHNRASELALSPRTLFHAGSFFALCCGAPFPAASELSATAPVFRPSASEPDLLEPASRTPPPPPRHHQQPASSGNLLALYHHRPPPPPLPLVVGNSVPELQCAVEALESHVTRLEEMLVALGQAPLPRPLARGEQRLPVDDFRAEIVTRARQSRVLIVRGETGSGKSSAVPRFFLESSARAKVIVTQPRRLAAVQLYERALSRGLPAALRLGMSGEVHTPAGDSNPGLWYVTAGVAAKLLAYKPRFFDDATHLLVDEVHERDADTDVVLALARERLRSRSHNNAINVVLLSATLDVHLLKTYFAQWDPPVVEIPGRRYDLERYFIEDLASQSDVALAGAWLPPKVSQARDEVCRLTRKIDRDAAVPRAVAAAQLDVLEWLVRALAAGTATGFVARAIMVFVAGWADVATVAERFEKVSTTTILYEIVPIHSELPFEAQRAALDARRSPSSSSRRVVRVVVATNAAESSLTLPDVDAVVDLCSRKLPAYDPKADRIVLRHAWSSRATMQQRAGRTGRVALGVAYHLVSKPLATRMVARDPPQVRAQPLDQVVLGLRASLPGRAVAPLMLEFPSPPAPRQIADAMVLLARRGLVEADEYRPSMTCAEILDALDAAPLTPAGALAAALPVDLRLSRLIMYGAAVGAIDDAIVMAAALSQPSPPWISPLPLPQLYSDVADFLVLARQALLGRQHFDSGDYSDPIARLRALKAWRALRSVSDRTAFCATYSLSASRMRQLAAYADALAARVRRGGAKHPPPPRKSEDLADENKNKKNDALVLRLILAWTFWDQVAAVEDLSKEHLLQSGREVVMSAKAPRVSRPQLAPLFPPVVEWNLVETRRLEYRATGVMECVGGRALAPEAQDELLRRFEVFAESLLTTTTSSSSSLVAIFADERLALRYAGNLVFDGPAPRRDSQLKHRVDALGVGCRMETGVGWATVSVIADRDVPDSRVDALFGPEATWTATTLAAAPEQTLAFAAGDRVVARGESAPPPNVYSLGEQLVASAILVSSGAKTKGKRVLRLPTKDRSGAVEVAVARGRVVRRPEWHLVASVAGIDAPAVFATQGLEAAYCPARPTVAVAASMTLFASEAAAAAASSSSSSRQDEAVPEEQTRARLDAVSVLKSREWLALALRAAGLCRASSNLAHLPPGLLDKADAIAADLHDLVDSGTALADPERSAALRARLEDLYDNDGFREPEEEEEGEDDDDDKRGEDGGVPSSSEGGGGSKAARILSDLARRLGTPQRGDDVSTPWGRGVVKGSRGDGTYVVDMAAWSATCYAQPGAIKLASRRGVVPPPTPSKPLPKKQQQQQTLSPVVVVPSRPRTPPPKVPPPMVPPLVVPHHLARSFTEDDGPRNAREDEEDERERLKKWILERSASAPAANDDRRALPLENENPTTATKSPLVEPPHERLRAVIARNPALCREKPQVIVNNATRWTAAQDAVEIVRVLVSAIVAATTLDSILKSPANISPCLALVAARHGQPALIQGLVRYCALDAPALVAKLPLALKALYDDDCLDEDTIFAWSDKVVGMLTTTNNPAEDAIAQEAARRCEPFLKWLREAEEEDDDV